MRPEATRPSEANRTDRWYYARLLQESLAVSFHLIHLSTNHVDVVTDRAGSLYRQTDPEEEALHSVSNPGRPL